MKTKIQPCPTCGAEMRHESKASTVEYLGHERRVKKLVAWWCTKCDEAILSYDAAKAREAVFLELKAEVDGVLGPKQVAVVRARLKLSQRMAGKLLGGGPRAFQKYEAGTQAVSVPMSRLLTLLANDPKRLRELRSA